jgi:hypothetical protein
MWAMITVYPWVCDWNWWRGQQAAHVIAPDSYAIYTGHNGCTRYDVLHQVCVSTKRLETWGCRESGKLAQSRCDFSARTDWRCGDGKPEAVDLVKTCLSPHKGGCP